MTNLSLFVCQKPLLNSVINVTVKTHKLLWFRLFVVFISCMHKAFFLSITWCFSEKVVNFLKNFDEQVVCRLLLTNLSLLIYRKPLPNSFINATIKTRELLQFRLLVISVLYEFKTLLMRRMVLFINSYCFFWLEYR